VKRPRTSIRDWVGHSTRRTAAWLGRQARWFQGWFDREFPSTIRWPALAVASVLTLGILVLLEVAGPLLSSVEHWTTDFRTAWLTYRLPSQHPNVALILVNEESVAEAQKDSPIKYRSPIDRGLLARIVRALNNDAIKPKAAGFDIIIDQPSDPGKDAAFLDAIKGARFPLVLARLDIDKAGATNTERAYQDAFLTRAERPIGDHPDAGAPQKPPVTSGYVTLKTEADGIVRALPTKRSDRHGTFAEELASRAAGYKSAETTPWFAVTQRSDRIAWLQPPRDNEATFVTISALELLTPPAQLSAMEQAAIAKLKDSFVVVGVKFEDPTDRHRTPFSRTDTDAMAGEMAGAEINAQVLAQVLDGRSYYELTLWPQLVLCFATALIGIVVGWRFAEEDFWLEVLPLVLYLGVNILLFWLMKFILPFAGPGLAWYVAIRAGSHLARREQQRNLVTLKEKQT
jgi:adenylate cyclase